MTFHLKIKIGNAAMLVGEDLANTLNAVRHTVESYNADDLRAMREDGARETIRDVNGNRVGYWTVEGDE